LATRILTATYIIHKDVWQTADTSREDAILPFLAGKVQFLEQQEVLSMHAAASFNEGNDFMPSWVATFLISTKA